MAFVEIEARINERVELLVKSGQTRAQAEERVRVWREDLAAERAVKEDRLRNAEYYYHCKLAAEHASAAIEAHARGQTANVNFSLEDWFPVHRPRPPSDQQCYCGHQKACPETGNPWPGSRRHRLPPGAVDEHCLHCVGKLCFDVMDLDDDSDAEETHDDAYCEKCGDCYVWDEEAVY